MEPSKQQSQSLEVHRLSVSVQTFFPPQLLVIKITIHRMHLSTQLYLRDFFFFSHRNELLSKQAPSQLPPQIILKRILITQYAAAVHGFSHPSAGAAAQSPHHLPIIAHLLTLYSSSAFLSPVTEETALCHAIAFLSLPLILNT